MSRSRVLLEIIKRPRAFKSFREAWRIFRNDLNMTIYGTLKEIYADTKEDLYPLENWLVDHAMDFEFPKPNTKEKK